MLTLLDEQYAPITSEIGFVRAPLDVLAEEVLSWRRGLYSRVELVAMAVPLPDALMSLEPLTLAVRPRELLVATDGDWTAYFDCLANGTDAFPVVRHLARSFQHLGVAITSEPETIKSKRERPGRNGAVRFELFGWEPTHWLNSVRAISVTSDYGTWKFTLSGQVQDFEDTTRYTARRIRDRFTSQMLDQYCRALGIRPFDPDFYRPQAVLLNSAVPGKPVAKMTLREAQQRRGIIRGRASTYPD